MTLPQIEESNSSGETQDSAASTATKRSFDELFQRVRDLERGQTTIVTSVAEFRTDMSRLITAAVTQAFHTPVPSPQPPRNQFHDHEYERYRNPEKQHLYGEGTSMELQTKAEQRGSANPPPLELTKKLDVPIFEGSNNVAGISNDERFFKLEHYPDQRNLDLVSVSFDGAAIGGFNAQVSRRPFRDGDDCKTRVVLRDGGFQSSGPSQNLFDITQNGPVEQSMAQFEDLSSQAQQLEAFFLNGPAAEPTVTVTIASTPVKSKPETPLLDSMGKTKVKPVGNVNPEVKEVEKLEERSDDGEDEVKQTEPTKSFEEVGLDSRLSRALDKKGIEKPTPGKKIAIPIILEGKDVVARAKTGSGKTLAYLLPLLQKLLSADSGSKKKCAPSAIISVPSRELCQQVFTEAASLIELGWIQLKDVHLISSMPASDMRNALAGPPEILVCTPACIPKCFAAGVLEPSAISDSLEILVRNEADLLLSYAYEDNLGSVTSIIPRKGQCLLLSATTSSDVEKSEMTNKIEHYVAHQMLDNMSPKRNKQPRRKALLARKRKTVIRYVWFKKKKVKIKENGFCVLPAERNSIHEVEEEHNSYLMRATTGHLRRVISTAGRWRTRLEVPKAEVAGMPPLARLISRSTYPDVHSQVKDLCSQRVQNLCLQAENLQDLLEIRGHYTPPTEVVLEDLRPPGLAELKGHWHGTMDAIGGGKGDTLAEADFHGDDWEWGTSKTERALAMGSYSNDDGVRPKEMGLHPTSSKLVQAQTVIYRTTDKPLEQKINVYKRLCLVVCDVRAICKKCPMFMNNSEKKICQTSETVKKWGLLEDEVLSMSKKYPQCIALSEKKIAYYIETFVGLGFTSDEFMELVKCFPSSLNFSAELAKKEQNFLLKQQAEAMETEVKTKFLGLKKKELEEKENELDLKQREFEKEATHAKTRKRSRLQAESLKKETASAVPASAVPASTSSPVQISETHEGETEEVVSIADSDEEPAQLNRVDSEFDDFTKKMSSFVVGSSSSLMKSKSLSEA